MEHFKTNDIDTMMRIVQDTKKVIGYDKSSGKWYWCDRSEADNVDAWYTGFPTFMSAVNDAIYPYL